MTESFSDKQRLKAFINAAQYIAGLTSGQDIWEEAGKVLIRFFGADFAAFVRRGEGGAFELGPRAFSADGAAVRMPEPEMIEAACEVFESGFLTFGSFPSERPVAAAFFPVLHENQVIAALLVGHVSSDRLTKETLDLYLAVAGLVGAAYSRDVSARAVLRAKEELEHRVAQRTAQLEATNRELEAFAYSVSHDLRAPLRAIEGFSRIIEEEQAERLDETGKEDFRRVREGANRMGQLIEALLSLSKQTRAEMKRLPVDMSHAVKTAADELRKAQPGRRADFVIAEGITVTGDPAMLRSVVANLLENAWKFTLKSDPACIEFGVAPMNGETVYFVRDNGAGFDPACANKLFTAFQRLHTEKEYPGIGIGLATVQRIIHRHGGRIWAEGEPGKGAVFYFTL